MMSNLSQSIGVREKDFPRVESLKDTDFVRTVLSDGTSTLISWANIKGLISSKTVTYNTTTVTTAPYQVTANNTVIFADSSGGNLVVILPDATGVPGQVFYIKKIDLNNIVTVQGQSQDIDGSASYVLGAASLDVVQVISNGVDWSVIGA